MPGDEARQPRDQPERGEAGRRRERHYLALARRADGLYGLAQLGQRGSRCTRHARPFVRELQRTVAPVEERHAEIVLERGDLPAHCGLRQRSLGRRLRERQVPRCGVEGDEQVEGGQPAGIGSHANQECVEFETIA